MLEIVSGMQRIWYDNIPHTIFADIDKYQIEDIHICLLLAICLRSRPGSPNVVCPSVAYVENGWCLGEMIITEGVSLFQ